MLRRRTERAFPRSARGMTLVEILIGGALISVVAGSAYLLYLTMLDTYSKGELKADLQQNARVGLSQMTREMRMAGYDPLNTVLAVRTPPNSAIRAAEPQCFSFLAGLADVEGSNETRQITYRLEGTTLKRKVESWNSGSREFSASGGAQPLADSVLALTFTYYGANNQVLEPSVRTSRHACPPDGFAPQAVREQLTFEQMRQIRRVAIILKTTGSRPGVSSESFVLTSDVYLRNF